MTLPPHLSIRDSAASPLSKGAGRTYYRRSGDTLEIGGAADLETLDAVIASGALDGVRSARLLTSAALTGLPDGVDRLTKLARLTIESKHFTDYASVYRLGGLTELKLTGQSSGELPSGIATLDRLRVLELGSKWTAGLPEDLSALTGLRTLKLPKALWPHLALQIERLPYILIGGGFGFESTGRRLDVKAGATMQGFAALAASDALDDIEQIVISDKATISGLPDDIDHLICVTQLTVKSAAFEDWASAYGLLGLERLTIEGSAQGALPAGISELTELRALWIRARGITALPPDLGALRPDLADIQVHAGLKPALADLDREDDARASTAALARFETWLATHAPDYLAGLAPGATPAHIAAVEEKWGISLPPAARAFYRWRDGDPAQDARFPFLRVVRDVAQAAELWDVMRRASVDNALPGTWSESWFPFGVGPDGCYLCVDLDGTFGGDRGQLIEVRLGRVERRIVATGLGAWIAFFVDRLESKNLRLPEDWSWNDRWAPFVPGPEVMKSVRDRP